jgi:hypothetical protein
VVKGLDLRVVVVEVKEGESLLELIVDGVDFVTGFVVLGLVLAALLLVVALEPPKRKSRLLDALLL